jgi:hypothetical protein
MICNLLLTPMLLKLINKADKYFQEMLMLAKKVDRHEKWLMQIADKIGIKLEY